MHSILKYRSTIGLALLALGGLTACSNGASPTATKSASEARILNYAHDGTSWPATGGDYSEQRFSPLSQINRGNVAQLGLAWEGDMDSTRGLEATPIVIDGIMYVSSTWSRVMAFDAVTGKKLWTYDPEVSHEHLRGLCCDVVNRGVAVWDGLVYVGTLDGRLVAINARTGKRAWETDTVSDHRQPYSITGAPRVVKGMVIIGNGGADRGARGYVTAYDAKTGKQVWRFYTVPYGPKGPFENADMERAAKTWPNDPIWTGAGGGTAWDAMAFDPDLDLLYIGTGNGAPWKRQNRLDDNTDNLYVASIVALNPNTGRIVWYYQETPGDKWDYTATNQMILADMEIGGRKRKIIMQAPKNGFFYVLDRQTGELLSADKYGPATWASHVDMKTGRPVFTEQSDFSKQDRLLYPNPNGDHDWQPISYSPETGLVYIPATDVPWIYSNKPGFRYFYDLGVEPSVLAKLRAGQPKVDHGGFLRAWDVRNRRVKWQVKLPAAWSSGTLATAGGLVFHASGDGYFNAYDAASGTQLAHIFTGNSAMAGPITYAIGDTQYVAIVAGYGGAGILSVADTAAVKYYENRGRVLVFKLGGGPVPPPAKRETPLGPPVVDNSGVPPLTEVQLERGRALYGKCAGCHGTGGSTGILPNLGRVREIGRDGFKAILLQGILQPNGMPSFADTFNESDVAVLYEYISRGEHNKPNKDKFY
jgi:quinohemoprotein ethanol dehydrogenase